MVVTVSLPVFSASQFLGVVGIDISLADLMADAAFLKDGSGVMSYAFVIDNLKQTLTHPLISQPSDTSHHPIFVDISLLEFNDGADEVIESMIRWGLLFILQNTYIYNKILKMYC